MIRRPPRSTLTDTLFPYTTLFRSTVLRFALMVNMVTSGLVFRCADIRNTTPYPPDLLLPQVTNMLRTRSEEHTSELQSLMRISYAVFCLKQKHTSQQPPSNILTPSTSSPT